MKSIGKFFHLPFRNRPRLLLVIERLLMAAGILAILIYGGARLYTWGYQAYTAYSFEEQLRGRTPSIRGFISHTFDRSHKPGTREHKPTAPPRAGGKADEKESQPDSAPPRVDGERLLRNMVHAPEVVPQDKGWSSSRLRAYRKAAPPAPGSVMGRLEIPSLDLSVMLLHGTDDWTLNRAVGHIEGTSLPRERKPRDRRSSGWLFPVPERHPQGYQHHADDIEGQISVPRKRYEHCQTQRCEISRPYPESDADAGDLLSVSLRRRRSETLHSDG